MMYVYMRMCLYRICLYMYTYVYIYNMHIVSSSTVQGGISLVNTLILVVSFGGKARWEIDGSSEY